MKLIVLALIALLTTLMTAAASAPHSAQGAANYQLNKQKISLKKAQALAQAHAELIILDVRTEQEYRAGHIDGAQLLPLEQIDADVERQFPDKERPYILYCRSGNRSAQAVSIMQQRGYHNIANGGGVIWQRAKLVKE